MKKVDKFNMVPKDEDMFGGIDMTGTFAKLFSVSTQVPGCVFLLCTQGSCKAMIHMTQYELSKDSFVILFPNIYFQITEQSEDCRFIFVGFSSNLIHSSQLFAYTIEITPYIFENPVIQLKRTSAKLIGDYLMVLIRSKRILPSLYNDTQIKMAYSQLILGLGGYLKNGTRQHTKHNRHYEVIKELIRLLIQNYRTERSISFYATQLNLSAQYLSSTTKSIAGKTLSEIITTFVIQDAKAKLCSTELTVQEIAYSLNFPDISAFGKYFKRCTGVSPKHYRITHK